MIQRHHTTAIRGQHEGDDDEIDLRQLVLVLWAHKYAIAAAAVICGVLAAASSYLFARQYQAEVVFVTLTDDAMGAGSGGLGSLASQLGGLASLGGFSISGNERKGEYLATLQSRSLLEEFITQNNLIPVLYAEHWDSAKGVWKDLDPKKQPTPWKATRDFKSKIIRLKTDSKTGISTLAISWSDPKVAASWANGLVEMANAHVRSRTIAEAERNVSYLNDQLTKTSVLAVQNSISTLLENQIKRIMLAHGTAQYAFRVIDPAAPSEIPTFPKRKMWGLGGLFIGMIAAIAVVAIKSFMINARTLPPQS